MSRIDQLYHQLSLGIIEQGYWYDDKSRNMRCKQLTSLTLDFDLQTEFPLLTTKKMYTKGIVGELLWFLKGYTNIKYLNDNGIHIWDKDATNFSDNGSVGRNYSAQWRNWVHKLSMTEEGVRPYFIDQITVLLQGLKDNPMSRRHIVTAWNPAELKETALPPCHWAFEILPRPLYEFEKELYPDQEFGFVLKWHQRSVDTFLGLPFNIASYGVLAKIIGEMTGYVALGIIGDLSNIHFYEGHIELAREQMKNNSTKYKGPELVFSDNAKREFKLFRRGTVTADAVFHSLQIEDIRFENYNSYEPIKAEMYEPTTNPIADSSDSGDKILP